MIGEMYIRNHRCSEYIFGTEPNSGKNMFGTFMFGTKINFGQKWNIGTRCSTVLFSDKGLGIKVYKGLEITVWD